MVKDADKNLSEEECNFLKEELKKIEEQIKLGKYDTEDNIKSQKILWTLRDNIIKQIGPITPKTIILKADQMEVIKDELERNKNNKNI
ncbi:MAG TPA: hypothetical protein VMZ91_03780 [Candidatus Paceibacterota bacterium]|nr:hypothetical protein [Candidatus Paceibacterota bacterium]